MAKHDDGSGIIAYDTFEEMMEDQQQAHEAAMENMTASQRAIPLGGFACNLVHLHDLGPIFGAIQSVEEVVAWNQLYYGVGDLEAARSVLRVRGIFKAPNYPKDASEKAWEEDGFATGEDAIAAAAAQHVESYSNGYLFGFWFSNMEPRGELGSAHASVCVQIDAESYEDAWVHHGYVSTPTAEKISATMQELRAEMKAKSADEEVAEATSEGEGDDPREER